MADFHRTFINDTSFIRGAARILVAPYVQARPLMNSDVIDLGTTSPVVAPTYAAKTGWVDLGATKTGIQITINNAEEAFDVDQILGDIASQPTSWECSVGTQLAEMTLERLQIAWEGSAITVDSTPASGAEKEIGFGQPTSYTQRRLAVMFQRPNGKVRGYLFHKVQRMPQESSVTHSKAGEQITIPVRFKCLADSDAGIEVTKRFFIIRDQATV